MGTRCLGSSQVDRTSGCDDSKVQGKFLFCSPKSWGVVKSGDQRGIFSVNCESVCSRQDGRLWNSHGLRTNVAAKSHEESKPPDKCMQMVSHWANRISPVVSRGMVIWDQIYYSGWVGVQEGMMCASQEAWGHQIWEI